MSREVIEVRPTEVDRALLDELALQVGPDRTEEPELAGWVADLQETLLAALGRNLGGALPWESLLQGLFWFLLAAVGLGLSISLALGLRAWLDARREQVGGDQVAVLLLEGAGLGEDPWDRLARLKGQGDASGALTALWEAVAGELSGRGIGRLQRDATHRDFVRSVRRERPDWSELGRLQQLARRLERLHFTSEPVTLEVVEELEPGARALLGGA